MYYFYKIFKINTDQFDTLYHHCVLESYTSIYLTHVWHILMCFMWPGIRTPGWCAHIDIFQEIRVRKVFCKRCSGHAWLSCDSAWIDHECISKILTNKKFMQTQHQFSYVRSHMFCNSELTHVRLLLGSILILIKFC